MSDEPVAEEEEVKEAPIQEQWPLTRKELIKRLMPKILIKRQEGKSMMCFYLKVPDKESGVMILHEVTRIKADTYNDLEPKEIVQLNKDIIDEWCKDRDDVLPDS